MDVSAAGHWYSTLGRRMAALRVHRSLSQDEVAERAGYAWHDVIGRYERGEDKTIHFDKLYRLCRALDVPMEKLLQWPGIGDTDVSWMSGDVCWPADNPPPETAIRTVQKRVRSTRLGKGWGTPRLGKAAGVAQTYIVRIESGEYQEMTMYKLASIAEALELPLHELLSMEATS